jgi:hypothetical protein
MATLAVGIMIGFAVWSWISGMALKPSDIAAGRRLGSRFF